MHLKEHSPWAADCCLPSRAILERIASGIFHCPPHLGKPSAPLCQVCHQLMGEGDPRPNDRHAGTDGRVKRLQLAVGFHDAPAVPRWPTGACRFAVA